MAQIATAFSDASHFGCVLDRLAGGLTGGFFNVSLTAIMDTKHRGDAYLGFLATKLLDIATGDPFDAEVPPRITSIHPQSGSLAGGTELTVAGTGFGSDVSALSIDVAGIPCLVTQVQVSGVHCRLGSNAAATAPTRPTPTAALGNDLGSFAGERGVRWQWVGANSTREKSMLLPAFAFPTDCAVKEVSYEPAVLCCTSAQQAAPMVPLVPPPSLPPGVGAECGSGWRELAPNGTIQLIEVSERPLPTRALPTRAPPHEKENHETRPPLCLMRTRACLTSSSHRHVLSTPATHI